MSREDYVDKLCECIFLSDVGWTYWDGLREIAQDTLRNGRRMPRELALWIADVLEGKRKRPPNSGKFKSLAEDTSAA